MKGEMVATDLALLSNHLKRQQEINEEICDILTCLIHSDDHYDRDVVDLNANAFLKKLKILVDTKQ